MLEKLTIRNFRPHRYFSEELEKITSIVGASDEGKSSILAAIRWACLNQPTGDDYITWGEEFCSVRLSTESGRITRKKGKEENIYQIDKEEPHRAIGKGAVPKEISDILAVDNRNFQLQHDSPYWLTLTPGQVGKELNEIINLEVMDKTLANLNKQLRKAKLTTSIAVERLETARRARDSYAWAEAAVSEITAILAERKDWADKRSRIAILAGLIEKGQALEEAATEAAEAASVGQALYAGVRQVRQLQESLDKLGNLIGMAKKMKWISSAKAPLNHLVILLDSAEKQRIRITNLRAKIDNILKIKQDAKQFALEAEEAKRGLEEKTQGYCPVCGQPIKRRQNNGSRNHQKPHSGELQDR